ncbi:PepSY-like domain-containing protein [Emticicia oligotrophica]|uniref:PepSY-like domain-containing protein n=1 Tax=Emticicia oligotrophica TaxID=312279 RepID=UPI00273B11EC|nr:PepSY-like domain-containing protein [Emticicia oligotrophica]
MRKLYIYMFFVGLILWSCDSVTDLQPQQNVDELVPKAAINAIKTNYPEATKVRFTTIEKNRVFQSDFDLKLERMSAIVNNVGVISEMYKQSGQVGLPDIVKNYIATNFVGAVYLDVCQQINKSGQVEGYKVRIKLSSADELTLIFDATGTLILSVTDDRDAKPAGQKPPKMYFIEKNELPQVILDYLSTKYGSDYKCIKAAVVMLDDVKSYSVVISKDYTTYDFLFDDKGNVLKSSSFGINGPPIGRIEDKPLSLNEIPSKIKAYLDKEFKGWKFDRGLIFLNNGEIQTYNILIIYGDKRYSLQFDNEQKFVKKEQLVGGFNDDFEVKNIQPKDLPAPIITFLTNKYPNFKYINTALINEKNKKAYWVIILSNNITYDYTFDDKGNVLNMKEIILKLPEPLLSQMPLEAKDIPSKAKEYLDANFKGWNFQKGFIAYVENKLFGYMIAIKVGNDYYYINFDANANFISARRG